MRLTPIGWTDYSANPLKYRDAGGKNVWACVKVSAGCKFCYSEALGQRYSRGSEFNAAEMAKLTPYLDPEDLSKMLRLKAASGKRCFVGDMTDIFGEWVPDDFIDAIFSLFARRADVTFQVLTKRPERMAKWFARVGATLGPDSIIPWPLPNVWIGTSAENQEMADERIPHLVECPAFVRFVSIEPLLGSVNLLPWLSHDAPLNRRLDWVIVGGESGQWHRDMSLEWMLDIADQCERTRVPIFVKQGASAMAGTPTGDRHLDALKDFPA